MAFSPRKNRQTQIINICEILEFCLEEYKIKSREQLLAEVPKSQWISYLHLPERVKVAKRIHGIEYSKPYFQMELCAKNAHVSAIKYKFLLKS